MHNTSKPIAVLGTGLLADAAVDALRGRAPVERISEADLVGPGSLGALVTVSDCWDLRVHPVAGQVCRALGIPWLPVHTELSTVVLGPVTSATRPGCPHCFTLRRERAGVESTSRAAIRHAHEKTLAERPSAMVTGLAASLVATLAAAELAAETPDDMRGSALLVRLDDLSIERHAFLPEPFCPYCGGLPDDSRSDAVIRLVSRPKPAPTQYRLDPLVVHSADLHTAYTGSEAGLIHAVSRDDRGGLTVAEAPVTLRVPGVTVPGGGRSWNNWTSDATAVLEALERYGGANPAGKRTVVRAAFAELDGQALDPRVLGTHEDELYNEAIGYRRFTEDSVCNWVWGHSFARSQPVLVPESCAYFWTRGRPDPPFVFETTNGCALGSCLEEAILYAILENAERDAFMLTWHSQIPAPAIDLAGADDRTPAMTAAAITHATGYDVSVFDTTTENGIPCVWALATHPLLAQGRLDTGTDALAMFCAAGSHLVPERAALSALLELGPQLADAIQRYPARKEEAARMLDNPDKVRTIFDHAVAFGDPRAYHRLAFLTQRPGQPRPLAEVGRDREKYTTTDLREDLREVIDRYLAENMDVIVVDQTAPEHRAQGLVCVKVLIPGSLPLTYGHHRRRLQGLPRLLTTPHRLGHTNAPLAPSDLNVLPHPFAA
ncbi:TOMM precursor leader peptide-binding protein [Streptomyces sp. NPDC002659]|uniref:TOMM precursor leader peptide-binding protein n=1 Tax=Streptomyces sp. NPDC002659 TaxID=3364656 RepID=UPI0036AFEFEE